MVQPGDIYLIPLQMGKQALATVLGLGTPPWSPRLHVMFIGAYDCPVEDTPPADLPRMLAQRYWCLCSFVEEGKWSLVRRGPPAASGQPSTADCEWATHGLFLDDLRQRLGLERQTLC